MWGFLHDQLAPDILTVGKGIGGGFPLSAVISTDEHSRAKPYALPSGSSSSYGGNPLAAAAGLATLEIISAMRNWLRTPARSVMFSSSDFRHSTSNSNSWGIARQRPDARNRVGEEQGSQERVDKQICRRIFELACVADCSR